jgi:hypothetical protein
MSVRITGIVTVRRKGKDSAKLRCRKEKTVHNDPLQMHGEVLNGATRVIVLLCFANGAVYSQLNNCRVLQVRYARQRDYRKRYKPDPPEFRLSFAEACELRRLCQ